MSPRSLRSLFALEGAALGLLMPFPVPLLDERGLGATQIGLILGLAGLASLAAYPVWGAIADAWLGRPRTIALASVAAATGGLWLLLAGSDPLALAVSLSLAFVGVLALGPLTDALTLAELGEGSSAYGRVRLFASAGWALAAAAAGVVWLAAGPEPVFLAFIAAALLLAVLASRWPAAGAHDDVSSDASDGGGTGSTAPGGRATLRGSLPLFMTPVLLGFLAGLLLTAVGEHAAWRFISLRILDQGGNVLLVGLAAALPAVAEIPVFGASRALVDRLGLRALFVSGAAIAALLMALVAIAPEPWMVTLLRSLDGVPYALRYTAMVLIIGLLLPRRLHATGQSVAWLVYAGIAPIAADVAGGLVYDTFGAPVLFLLTTAALGLGGTVAWLSLRGTRFGRVSRAQVAEAAPPPPM